MFHSAALKLTIWYLTIIMAISLIFSGLLYRVSSADLEHGANRQIGYFNNFLQPEDFNNYNQFRKHQLNEDKSRLKANLFVFNLLVLFAGGAVSYLLARRTLEPIEDALKAQSRFAADASHELRTPLTAIQTENEVALRNSNLTKSDAIQILKSNLEEVAKLKALSEGLLRLASGNGLLENPEKVAVNDCLNDAIARNQILSKEKGVKIKKSDTKLTVKGDYDSLVELFSIFIDNAIKYSAARSQIQIIVKKRGNDVIIQFKDQGKGISSQDLPNIFERFYRTDSSRSKNQPGGYGLGLSIAKKIVQAHKGHIEVTSQVDKGSLFTVILPAG